MKKFIKLIPALAMLLIATMLVSTATFAWFSMNSSVSVTGMQIKTRVSDNLLIAEATDGTADNDGEDEDAYKKAITTEIKAILEPASTIDGVKYFYTSTDNVVGNGDARADQYIPYSNYAGTETLYGTQAGAAGYTDKFSQNYGISSATAGGMFTGLTKAEAFKDYAFYLKATNTATTAKDVNITALNLTYGTTPNGQDAFRVAVFVDEMTSATSAEGAVADMDLISIVRPSGATYFTTDSAVKDASTIDAIDSGDIDQDLTIGSVDGGDTVYFKVVVRIWLEGEDDTCNNETFATLTDAWMLDVVIKMDGTAAVDSLSNAQQAKTNLSAAAVAAPAVTKVVDNVTYTKLDTQVNGQDAYVLGTTFGSASRVFVFTADGNPIEVTNQCTLPTT
jgi:hypothetical protein